MMFWPLFSLLLLIFMSVDDSVSIPSKPMIRRGAFFLFEGLDRSGKSTQVSLLTKYLAERSNVEQIRFPDRSTVIGGLINNYLQSTQELNDCSIHLLFSANRWERSAAMEKQLKEGVNLVSSNYMLHIILLF
ncbi:hypothetical protein EON65_46835 [archaeon]|nr:MAG: hypothetical protein EON65_46835 [archaeon]